MTIQFDLFNPGRRYPSAPGFKDRTTSREAARKIVPRVDNLQKRVMAQFVAAWPKGWTADEIALRLDEDVLSIRPRVTELKAQGKVERTTDRRKNKSGMSAWVWRQKRSAT